MVNGTKMDTERLPLLYESEEGIVEVTDQVKLEKFLIEINNLSRVFPTADVIVASRCFDPLSQEIGIKFIDESLAEIRNADKRPLKKINGLPNSLYRVVSEPVTVTSELRETLLRGFDLAIEAADDDQEKEKEMEAIAVESAAIVAPLEISTLLDYYRKLETVTIASSNNIVLVDNNIDLCDSSTYSYKLKKFPRITATASHHSDAIDIAVGVNRPSLSVGIRFANLPMQTQHHWLDNISCLLYGHDKLWIIIKGNAYGKLRYAVQRFIMNATIYDPAQRKKDGFGDLCFNPLLHRRLFIPIDFLKEHAIPFAIIRQRCGDAIYVKERIFYQIINLGMNFSESICIGSKEWMGISRGFEDCQCEHSGTHMIEIPLVVMSESIDHQRRKSDKGVDEDYVKKLSQVTKQINRPDAVKDEKVTCDRCAKSFRSKKLLMQHIMSCILRKERPMCPYCDKCMDARNLHRHIEAKHPFKNNDPKPFKCSKCKKKFVSKAGLKGHGQSCYKRKVYKPYKCKICRKEFKIKTGLKLHQPRCLSRMDLASGCPCSICKKIFKGRAQLKEHQLSCLKKYLFSFKNQ